MNDIRDNLTAPKPGGVLEDIAGGETNLLPAALLDSDLQVKFDAWPNSDPSETSPETVRLYWDGAVVNTKEFTEPLTESNQVIDLPKGKLTDGVHILKYIVDAPTSGISESDPTTVTVDKFAPSFATPNAAVLPADLPTLEDVPTVTKAYLDANPEGVRVEVPRWSSIKPGDQVIGFLEANEDADRNYPFEELELTLETINVPIRLTLTKQRLDSNNSSTRYISYQLMDRAGNRTEGYSRTTEIKIDLTTRNYFPPVSVVPFV
jgi:hypothetical protein